MRLPAYSPAKLFQTGGIAGAFYATALCLSLFAVPVRHAAAAPEYHEVNRFQVGGEGGWDYLVCDSPGHRLFITRGSHVQVVSTETGKVIGDIPSTKGCHGVALAPDLGRGFVSDGGDNTVTIFDLKTLKTIETVAVGKRPDAILYDSATHRVFTFNAGSSDTTAVDAATGKVVGTIALGGKPEFSVSDGAGRIFANLEDKSELLTLDPQKLAVISRTALGPAEEPSGLAIDRKRHLLFAACGNGHAAVVDSQTGKLVATPAIGDGPDAASADAESGLAFTSNGGDATLSIISESKPGAFAVTSIKTERGARTMTIDPATHRLYLVTAKYETPAAGTQTSNGRPARPRPVPDSFVVLVYGQ